MQTQRLPFAEVEAILDRELAEMLKRCEAAGLSQDQARTSLRLRMMSEYLAGSHAAAQEREAREAQSPAGRTLQAAYEAHLRMEEQQRLGITPDTSGFDALCESYLLMAHGVKPGDTVEVHGWAKPRTLRLTKFRLSFYRAESATDAFMWFEGEGIRNCPRNRASSDHGCPLHTAVRKV